MSDLVRDTDINRTIARWVRLERESRLSARELGYDLGLTRDAVLQRACRIRKLIRKGKF